jgi:hypothetical protein
VDGRDEDCGIDALQRPPTRVISAITLSVILLMVSFDIEAPKLSARGK